MEMYSNEDRVPTKVPTAFASSLPDFHDLQKYTEIIELKGGQGKRICFVYTLVIYCIRDRL